MSYQAINISKTIIEQPEPVDSSLSQIWHSWQKFQRGKRKSSEMEEFSYHLEENLSNLHFDLESGHYRHGTYREFTVCENKKRSIRVASIRDRVIHRLLYDYLVRIYDHTFIFDLWSCRKSKGLTAAIMRAQKFLSNNPKSFVWRVDIKKFFDNVDQNVLMQILERKIRDRGTLSLLNEVIKSTDKGIPIGNLTSQIFANIYLNEMDRYIKNELEIKHYLRYGDDFIILSPDLDQLRGFRTSVMAYLSDSLKLSINTQADIITKAKEGIHFLGVEIYPSGRRLSRRNWQKIITRLSLANYSSYSGLVKQNCSDNKKQIVNWLVLDLLDEFN